MTEREALKQALEALESSRVFVTTREKIKHPEGTEWYDQAITAIKEALAQPDATMQSLKDLKRSVCDAVGEKALSQPEQEPVAEARYDGTLHWLEPYGVGLHRFQGPLFTSPPAQRKPLTDDEIFEISNGFVLCMFPVETRTTDRELAFARAIEKAVTRQPQIRPLTDDVMWKLWNSQGDDAMEQQAAIAFARAIEAAHGIKENT